MLRFAFTIALLAANVFAQEQKLEQREQETAQEQAKQTVILYISGDYSSIEYHLGTLSEIERLKIPVDSIVATGWGAFAGGLWSAGWSAEQIRDLAKSFEYLPQAAQPRKHSLWHKAWLIKHGEDGTPFMDSISDAKPYFGKEFFDLQIQEAYWRSDIGSKIPFLEIDSANSYPFPPPSSEQGILRIFSNPVALRDTNGSPAQRYQNALWNSDSSLIILRPHSKLDLESPFNAGVHAVQNKRSQFLALKPRPAAPEAKYEQRPPRFVYIPVFDSVPAELQRHLESFWNAKDTGSLAVKNFLGEMQEDGSYQSVKLTMDTSSLLQINAENSPVLSLSLQGIGGTFLGANAAANANFRFVNQFAYSIDLKAFYGQGIKGIVPEIRFGNFFMDDGDFFAKAKFLRISPIPYFQKRIEHEARIISEKSNGITFGVEKPLGIINNRNKPVLLIAVEIDNKGITSAASGSPNFDICGDLPPEYFDECYDSLEPIYEYRESIVNSMFPYAKWLWQSADYDRWFSAKGFMAELTGGFKAVSVRSYDQDAPLYVSTQGKISITHPLSRFVSLMAGTEFGLDFRREGRDYPVPSPIDNNPALDNRYRFAMGLGASQEQWQTTDNASHRYGLLMSGLALHMDGSGLFIAAGLAKDGEQNPWAWEFSNKRLFAEPKIRIRTSAFDFVAGYNMMYFAGAKDYFAGDAEKKKSYFLEFRGMLP